MTPAEDNILEELNALIRLQGPWGDVFEGVPFVVSQDMFGLRCGPENGSLYAIHHLIDSLEGAGFFKGAREPATDLDAMMYRFGIGETKIYDGVMARRTPETMSLTIETDRPVEAILKALRAGVAAAQAKQNQRRNEEERVAAEVREAFAKEEVAPLFGEEADVAFVKAYLKAKTDGFFQGEPEAQVEGPYPARKSLGGLFAKYDIVDRRPRFEVRFTQTEENLVPFNAFMNDVLGKIFTGPLAVSPDEYQWGGGLLDYSVNGNPARLARDIVGNDPELGLVVMERLGLSLNATTRADMERFGSASREKPPAPVIGS